MENTFNSIMDYEAGTMDQDDIIPFFQKLIDSGKMKELRDACDKADVAYEKGMEAGGK
jgi:hypothetical protein